MKSTRDPDIAELVTLRLEAAKLKLRRPENSPEPGKHSGTAGESVIHAQENTDEYNREYQSLNRDTGIESLIHEWGTQL
ncbi:MAG TPA: hypothetical protein VJN01_12715, partial [Xanthomonadales bacterium]|nr:hypothetical protein [Xanthomonadales bacterium]